MQLVLTTELLLEAYRQGLFPMAYSSGSPYIHWICPEMRGQLSIENIHIPRRLKKTLRKAPYEVRIDTAFEDVIGACATPHADRPETWINKPIIEAYCKLHKDGYAHSIECWECERLVGGLYGLAIGSVFFGESMFSARRDASKIALIHLIARLWKGGFTILDTQFVNAHLKQFGVHEIPHRDYLRQLRPALGKQADFSLTSIKEKDLLGAYLNFREPGK